MMSDCKPTRSCVAAKYALGFSRSAQSCTLPLIGAHAHSSTAMATLNRKAANNSFGPDSKANAQPSSSTNTSHTVRNHTWPLFGPARLKKTPQICCYSNVVVVVVVVLVVVVVVVEINNTATAQ